MLPVAQLRRVIAALPPAKYRRTLFRAVLPKYLLPPNQPISGVGAKLRGARYTPVGSFETIYFAEDPQTAFIEFHYPNLQLMHDMDDPFAARLAVAALVCPWVTVEKLRVLDLTRHEIRAALGTDISELISAWRVVHGATLPPTQILGNATHSSALFQAIRFRSARRSEGVCVAIFPDRLVQGTSIELDDSRNAGPMQKLP
jgi:RES domain-containing protein